MLFVTNEVKDTLWNDITLKVPRMRLDPLHEAFLLLLRLCKKSLRGFHRVQDLHAQLLVQFHQDTGLVVLALEVVSHVRIDVARET